MQTRLLTAVLLALGGLGLGCGDGTSGTMAMKKNIASTPPKMASTKPSGTPAKPMTTTNSSVTSNMSSAADTGTACTAADEGLGACFGTYVVFCVGGELYALDCAQFVDPVDGEIATCDDEFNSTVTCDWAS
jgi:hypothetical protein